MEKIKILFLAADVDDRSRLHLDHEYRSIKDAIAGSPHASKLDLRSEWAVRIEDFLPLINEYRPHILHFTGHGRVEGLHVADKEGRPQFLFANGFIELIAHFSYCIECVVLSACWGEQTAQAINKHIPYIAATNDAVIETAAIRFAQAFYKSLATEATRNYPKAFDWGKIQARMAADFAADAIIWLENEELAKKLKEYIGKEAEATAEDTPPIPPDVKKNQKNQATITGQGNMVIQGVEGTSIHIYNGGDSNKE